jgi:hypothetical protein
MTGQHTLQQSAKPAPSREGHLPELGDETMTPKIESQLVITGPREAVAELVLAFESGELGRRPGDSILPLDAPCEKAGPPATDASDGRNVEVLGPVVTSTEAGDREVRYTVRSDGSLGRSVQELARRVPELMVVLAERSSVEHAHLNVYRAGAQIASISHACGGLLLLTSKAHQTLQDCIRQADQHALATGELKAFAVLGDVRLNGTSRHDAGAWHAITTSCADGSALTLATPDIEAWTAQQILTNAPGFAALLEFPRSVNSPVAALAAVFADLLPYSLVGRDPHVLQEITVVACAWAAGRPVDDEVEAAVAELFSRLPARAVAEAALGSGDANAARLAVDRVIDGLNVTKPHLMLVRDGSHR